MPYTLKLDTVEFSFTFLKLGLVFFTAFFNKFHFLASDWTMYPFSTQNQQDYENLMSVYLDAAFRPRLSELDFRQEGWRLEHVDPNDKTTSIVFKGVVFNEMKGVFVSVIIFKFPKIMEFQN